MNSISTESYLNLKKEIPFLKKKFHISYLGIIENLFVRKDKLNVLVEFSGNITLFDIVDLEEYLNERMKTKTVVFMKSALRKRMGLFILNNTFQVI